ETLVEQWNGTSWARVASPTVPGADSYLNAVRCPTMTNCVAVGYSSAASDLTLVERWNGAVWSTDASPNSATPKNYRNGVACAGTPVCFAVGDYGSAPSRTLIGRSCRRLGARGAPSPGRDPSRRR